MDVHVPQAGNQVAALGVGGRCVAGIACVLARADGGDAVALDDDDLIGTDFSCADIDDVDVGDDQRVVEIPVLRGGALRVEGDG